MIQQTEVDGVPTLIAPLTGPMNAGLVFRVGRADETLATAGVTHLIEHLALHRHGQTDYHFNGATDAVYTHFHVQGSEADIVAYLHGVCDSLANLPMDRLETEKQILRTESSSRRTGPQEAMPLWRYGARGYGLLSYPEWGLRRLSEQDVLQWAQTWFTRENAVLWIGGSQIPAGLRLNLRSGRRMAVPAVTSALPLMPAFFRQGDGGVIFDAVVRRSAAAQVFAGVLERDLFRALRQEGGYSYTAAADYSPRGDDFATITALADALPDKQDAVVGGFLDVLAKLKAGRIDTADITAVRAKAEESFNHPDSLAGRLPGYAMNVLTGQPLYTLDELRAEILKVTADDVHQVAISAMDTALVQVPGRHRIDWAGFEPAPTYSQQGVSGTTLQSLEDDKCSVVIGPEGISSVHPSGTSTVRFDECAAKFDWPDGARRLIGHDGISVHFEPTLYRADPQARAVLDAGVDHLLVVQFPARDAEDIPMPAPPVAAPVTAPVKKVGVLETIGTVLLGLMTLVMVCVGGLATAGVSADPEINGDAAIWAVIGIIWFGALCAMVPMFFLIRRRVRYRRDHRSA